MTDNLTEHDYDEDTCYCDGCGRDVNFDEGHCPICCMMGSYAPGCEECDWCEYSQECFEAEQGRYEEEMKENHD